MEENEKPNEHEQPESPEESKPSTPTTQDGEEPPRTDPGGGDPIGPGKQP
jgi:hypothetical protein